MENQENKKYSVMEDEKFIDFLEKKDEKLVDFLTDKFGVIDDKFERVDDRFDSIDKRINKLEEDNGYFRNNMVTKDYLDRKLEQFVKDVELALSK